jgi:hypothetical protein
MKRYKSYFKEEINGKLFVKLKDYLEKNNIKFELEHGGSCDRKFFIFKDNNTTKISDVNISMIFDVDSINRISYGRIVYFKPKTKKIIDLYDKEATFENIIKMLKNDLK